GSARRARDRAGQGMPTAEVTTMGELENGRARVARILPVVLLTALTALVATAATATPPRASAAGQEDLSAGPRWSPAAIVSYPDGHSEAFVRGPANAVFHARQLGSGPDGPWSGWSSLGGVILRQPAAAVNLDGRAEIWAWGNDYRVYRNVQI